MIVKYTATTTTRVQRSVGSKVKTNGQTDRQTDGQTDAAGCFTFPANAVGNRRITTAKLSTDAACVESYHQLRSLLHRSHEQCVRAERARTRCRCALGIPGTGAQHAPPCRPKWITRQPPEMTFVRRRLPWSA